MRYTFFEALAVIIGTERKLRTPDSGWFTYHYDSRELQGAADPDKYGPTWWPTLEEQKAKIWEVEPEEIYVWGKCDDDNDSWIYTHGIPKSHLDNTIVPCEDLDGTGCCFKKGLFPTDKFQKFKLVPVEEAI